MTNKKTRYPIASRQEVEGNGKYFHIEVRSRKGFDLFRTHDVGKTGRLQRLVGKRPSGSWDTVQWLISKEDAHLESGNLVPDSADAEKVLATLGSKPVHVKGDMFKAKPRRGIRAAARSS